MEPGSETIRAAIWRVTRRARARLRRGFPVGIAGRLAASFAAVAILAVAANLILERGIGVVQTTRLDRGQYSPIPVPSRAAVLEEAQAERRSSARVDAAAAGVERFSAAVNRLQRALEMRVSVDADATADEAHDAQQELERAASVLRSAGQPPDLPLETALRGYEQAGVDYVQSADERRAALEDYQQRLDAIDRRITASLDGAWKLFGRVLARESLMHLHSASEELRRRFAEVIRADGDDRAALDALAGGEDAFASSLHLHEHGLLRSEGAGWLAAMREDLTEITALHRSIVEGGSDLRDSAQQFSAARARLAAATPDLQQSVPAPRPEAKPAPRAALPPALASPVVDAVTTTTITTTQMPDRARRVTIAAITAAVLLILLAISIWTVRSILIPVSRMIDATGKLARGDVAARVPRGGMKELDALAIAFNRMAAQLLVAREITQDYRKTLESQVEQRTRLLQHLAEHDPLTLLVNRRQFFVLLNRSLQRARDSECGVGVFFIDLDNFKNLNDSMGHAFGDRVLISVAQRLEETAASFGFAARLGGDEFTVVHEELDSIQSAYEAGGKIVQAFQRSLSVDGRELTVSVSVGASIYPDHEQRAEDLLSAADAALFRAKALGRNQLAIFTPELLETASRKFTTEQGIRRALEHDEFELVFQPEVSLDSLQVGLVEALVRWRLPDGRLATPDEFLAVTEESGLIIELGNWVLRHAIETASNWHHGLWPDVKIAINVSPRQLLDHGFVERVQSLLREFRLPAQCIELELTESVLQTGAATIDSLRLLRSLDIAIALDDFGTGYSSFASLEQLPLSRIKLDRTLIAGIDVNARSAAIATALIQLCNDLGIEVTAEGVERDSQFHCLASHRTLHLQGYLISRPVLGADVLPVNRSMPQVMHDLLLSSARAQPESSLRRVGARQELTAKSAKR
jgi:diguanylate cyclase (GGDEF)-like protein